MNSGRVVSPNINFSEEANETTHLQRSIPDERNPNYLQTDTNTEIDSEIELGTDIEEVELCTPEIRAWKYGGFVGTISSTLIFSMGEAFSNYLQATHPVSHLSYQAKFISTVASVFLPLSIAVCANCLAPPDARQLKSALAAFAFFGAFTGTVDAVASTLYPMNAAYPYVVPAGTALSLLITNCVIPEVCEPVAWQKLAKLSKSMFSVWNNQSASRNKAVEIPMHELNSNGLIPSSYKP